MWLDHKLWSGEVRWNSPMTVQVAPKRATVFCPDAHQKDGTLRPIEIPLVKIPGQAYPHTFAWAQHDGILFVSSRKDEIAYGDAMSRIALSVKTPYADLRQCTESPASVKRAATHVALGLIEDVVRDHGGASLLCTLAEWDYHKWREGCERVREATIKLDPAAESNRHRAGVISVLPTKYFRPLLGQIPMPRPEPSPLPWATIEAFEKQSLGDTWVFASNAVQTPVFMPVHGVGIIRNQYLPHAITGMDVRIVAFPNEDRVAASCIVFDRSETDDKPDFDPGSFRARRRARSRR
tara:strand:+ start:319 stop:1200 length:882 start_codon:yes stop_codon:yes gene_type:complete